MRIQTLTAFLVLTVVALGAPRSERDAAEIASKFLSSTPTGKSRRASVRALTQPAPTTQTPYYVFNSADGEGFVIVSGDDKALPVLAYADEGRIDFDNMPVNLKSWLQVYEHQMKMLADLQAEGVDSQPADVYDTEVKPLLGEMRWDQDTPFNNMCPVYSGNVRCAAGCVAIAVAQIMAYHRYPTKCSGSVNYTDEGSHAVNVNFADSVIDWDNILSDYLHGYTAQQARAVASLSYMVGAAHYMEYDYSSGASEYYTPYALVGNFGYDDGIALVDRRNYSNEKWCEVIKNELDNERPVMYTGATTANEGHAFVVDGYNRQGLFHVNWGWGGVSNGYYALSALNPTVQGIGGASSLDGFNCYQDAVIAIQPAYSHSDYYYPDLGVTSLTASQNSISRNGNVSIYATGIFNSDGAERTINAALGVYDKDNNLIAVLGSKEYTAYPIYPRTTTFRNISVPSSVPNGNYELRFIYTNPGSSTWNVGISNYGTPCFLPMTVTSTQIIFGTPDMTPKLELVEIGATTTLYAKTLNFKQKGGFTFTVKNSHIEFFDSVQIAMRKVGSEDYTLIGAKIMLNVPADASVTLPVTEFVTVSSGTYELALAVYTTGTVGPTEYLTNGTTVEVLKSGIRPTIKLQANSITFDDNLNVYQNRCGMTLSVTNNGSDICTDFFVYIYAASDSYRSTLLQAIESRLTCLASGETVEIQLGDYLELPPGDYQAYAYYTNASGAAIPLTPTESAVVFFTMRDGAYTAVNSTQSDDMRVDYDPAARTIIVNAQQNNAVEVFNAAGVKVAAGVTGQAISTSALTHGVYVVRAGAMARKIVM